MLIRNLTASPFGRKAPPPALSVDNWLEPRRSPFSRSKYRSKSDRNSISLDYAINNDDYSPGARQSAVAAAAILEDPFDADWAALAMRTNCQPTPAQRHPFQEEKAWI